MNPYVGDYNLVEPDQPDYQLINEQAREAFKERVMTEYANDNLKVAEWINERLAEVDSFREEIEVCVQLAVSGTEVRGRIDKAVQAMIDEYAESNNADALDEDMEELL